MVMFVSHSKLNYLEENISCYYKTYNRFPKDDIELNNFLDSLNFTSRSDSIFSKLVLTSISKHSLKYNFELIPFSEQITSSPKNNNLDSIKVDKFIGELIFNDSLFIENKNKLLVKLKIDSLLATNYENEDSVKCTENDLHIFQDSSFENLLSINSCCTK
ncbi:MAG: hypothetical protein IPH62_00060 [Ignavibacteriae bacterium]|nr:hypothetical protein [Ignavibacteriota bacterium]